MANYDPFNHNFDNIVEKALAKWHIASISVAIVDKGSTHFQSYGSAILDTKTPADKNTLYHAASTTKAQLCAAWGLYISSRANESKPRSERITWRTRLIDILGEEFQLYDASRTSAVTLEDALSHRTGMPRHDFIRGHPGTKTVEDITRNLDHLPLHNDLRTDFEYCNLMFIVASYALEKVTGKPLSAVLRESLWNPLGMHSTYAGDVEANEAVRKDSRIMATCYTWSRPSPDGPQESRSMTEQPHPEYGSTSGAGYVISTASDYAKWMQALVGNSSSSPLIQDLRNELWTPRTLVNDPARKVPLSGIVAYALGWFTGEYRRHMAYWHSGGATGSGSFVLIVPDLEWGITFFANGHDVSSSIKGIVFELLDARLGVPEAERTAFKKCEESYIETLRKSKEAYDGCLGRLFPNGAIDSSPSGSTCVEQYSGKYRNLNYGTIKLEARKDKAGQNYLHCETDDRVLTVTLELYPVTISSQEDSEDWFLVTLYDPSDTVRQAVQAKGQKNSAGEVKGIDVAFEPAMPAILLPFDRVK